MKNTFDFASNLLKTAIVCAAVVVSYTGFAQELADQASPVMADVSTIDGTDIDALLEQMDELGDDSQNFRGQADAQQALQGDPAAEDLGASTDSETADLDLGSSPVFAARGSLEEVQVLGRATRGSESRLRVEVFNADVQIDALSALEISRNGDSNVASSLVRLPGLTLIDEQYVYVRGLGERYASNTVNQSLVPSPDLTRDVLPLDIFPTSIIESLAVRKAYDADRPATFAGGEIDLRTKTMPDEFFFEIKADIGANADLRDYKTYPNHTTIFGTLPDREAALSSQINTALTALEGRIDPIGISDRTAIDLSEAEAVNRELATHVNRDFRITPSSGEPDYGLSIGGGDRYRLNDEESSLGYIAFFSWDQSYRHYEISHRGLRNPEQDFSQVDESRKSVNLVGYASVGIEFPWNQQISLSYLFLRNGTDQTYIEDARHSTFDEDTMRRRYWLRFQSRDLVSWQVKGSHGPEDFLHFNWRVSLSRVINDMPSELRLNTRASMDSQNGAVTSEIIENKLSDLELGYTTLGGRTNDYGFSMMIPIGGPDRHRIEFGFDLIDERRDLTQLKILLGSNTRQVEIVGTDLLGAFTPEYINDANNDVQIGFRRDTSEPYFADARSLGFFGLFRFALGESWRLKAGLRWERYSHSTRLSDPLSESIIGQETKYIDTSAYPSLNALYTSEGNNWSDTFQLRLSYGRTVVRPDAREISSAVYIHPVTNARVSGGGDVTPSVVDSINASMAWRFDTKEFLSLAVFYKSIRDPIETFEAAVSDNDTSSQRAQQISNADRASVYGIELDGRINLVRQSLFLSGNLTWLDSRLSTGDLAFSPTNTTRKLTNASDYIANLIFGYEHPEGDHVLRLTYSLFGERLHYAGRNGAPDAFESPTQWLNINYIYAFDPGLTLQVKIDNILDEGVEITRGDSVIYSRNIGREYSMSFSWRY